MDERKIRQFEGDTQSDGTYTFTLKKAARETYTTTIKALGKEGYKWDSSDGDNFKEYTIQ